MKKRNCLLLLLLGLLPLGLFLSGCDPEPPKDNSNVEFPPPPPPPGAPGG